MILKFFFVPVLMLFFATVSQSQIDCIGYANDYERQECEKRNKLNEQRLYKTRFEKPDKSLLPKDENAWVLHLITFGGLSGKGLPTITITSKGLYACGEAENLDFKITDADEFQTLSETISSANFNIDKSTDKAQELLPMLCKDCYRTEIRLARRESKGKVKTYRNDSDFMKYPRLSEVFSSIKKEAFGLANCS